MPDPAPSAPRERRPSFQAPTGTRDLYPVELARRRWIESKWRTVALRHGFDEIDGPTFESSDLYAVKSGDGILNELFQTFSGKDPEQAKLAGEGRAPYALRPEFTPTLARMYAARAAQLPKPAKWFWQGPCFRAERPQRGRLREFWQWNCDVIGEPQNTPDCEILAVVTDLLETVGLSPATARIKFSERTQVEEKLRKWMVPTERMPEAWALLDQLPKLKKPDIASLAERIGFSQEGIEAVTSDVPSIVALDSDYQRSPISDADQLGLLGGLRDPATVPGKLYQLGIHSWCEFDSRIVRGLAYYTGMVFEVLVDGERAVAGGGRYDNLIELFGGPPTPACGFGMGDVVLALVLQDKGLMPSDKAIARELGLRPDVFVISNGSPDSDAALVPTLAALRKAGLHARRSHKSTKNIGKLLKDAADQQAQYAVILEDAGQVTIKDLDTNRQHEGQVPLADLRATPRTFLPPAGLP